MYLNVHASPFTAQVIKHNSTAPAKREAMLHAEEDDQPIATLDIYEG